MYASVVLHPGGLLLHPQAWEDLGEEFWEGSRCLLPDRQRAYAPFVPDAIPLCRVCGQPWFRHDADCVDSTEGKT